MDLNRATILGRLTRDPEVRTTTSGRTVTNMTIATGRSWKDQSGAVQEKTEFHNVVMWGKLGEIAGQYLTKGRRVYLEGRIETRDWTGQDGMKRYRTEIIGENLIMLDAPRGTTNGPVNTTPEPSEQRRDDLTEVIEEVRVEDIPF